MLAKDLASCLAFRRSTLQPVMPSTILASVASCGSSDRETHPGLGVSPSPCPSCSHAPWTPACLVPLPPSGFFFFSEKQLDRNPSKKAQQSKALSVCPGQTQTQGRARASCWPRGREGDDWKVTCPKCSAASRWSIVPLRRDLQPGGPLGLALLVPRPLQARLELPPGVWLSM